MRAFIPVVAALCLASTSMARSAQQAPETRVYEPGNGVSAPVLVKDVKPQYTPDAMRAGVQGAVALECVVQPDGTIGEVRVTKALDPGLDQEAVKAVKQWRFTPGRKEGKPVPVRVTLEMTFTLRDRPAQPVFPVRPVSPGGASGTGPAEATAVHKAGNGVSAPVPVREVKPQYTAEAQKAKIEGIVELECVVEKDGRIEEVTVTKSLDEGLDQQAIKAVRQWRFEPGRKDKQPVRVLITLEMTFTLR